MNTAAITASTLDHVCTLVTDGTHDTPKPVSTGYPLIKAKEIVSGRIDFENCVSISREDHLAVIARSKPEHGDTLFTHIGASLGAAAYVNTRREFSIKNIALFKPDPEVISGRYLYYLAISPQFYDLARATRTGSAQPFLSLGHLRSHPIKYHTHLDDQCKIASILSGYDDLIENNLRRIQILEEMAQALYREWFVEFRFPDRERPELVDSPLGRIPVGWEVKSFSDVAAFVNGFAFKPIHWQETGRPIVKIKELKNGITADTPRYHGKDIAAKYHITNGCLLFSWSADLDAYLWCGGDALLNQHLFNVIPADGISRPYFYYVLRGRMQEFRNLSLGTTMRHIKRSALTQVRFVLAPVSIREKFEELVTPILTLIRNLYDSIDSLRQSRDLLLPRLISGALDVSDLDIEIGEAE